MANKEIGIIVKAYDEATKELGNIGNNLSDFAKRNESLFENMAVGGTAAFIGIGAAVNSATQAAAIAEGRYNKFNVVFGETADEMRLFVDDIRQRMPLATDEIVGMAGNLQDLLVPMGLSREEAMGLTQESLELANALAAFNDVDPGAVLQAMQAGFRGEGSALTDFGIDASIAALEARALTEGLIEQGQTFATLDPLVRKSIQAQALMAQMTANSADAIAGFESNSDSLIFRQQELQASLREVSVIVGNEFIPILDGVVKAVLPVIRNIATWIGENSELVKNIIVVGGAIAGAVAVIGTLGLAIPKVIAAFGLLKTAIVGIKAVMSFALLNPIGLAVTAVAGLGFVIYKNRDTIKKTTMILVDSMRQSFNQLFNIFGNIAGKAKERGSNVLTMFKDGFMSKINDLKAGVLGVADTIKGFLGFSSPTDLGPLSNSDQWIPNLIDMMSDGLNQGESAIRFAMRQLSGSMEDGLELNKLQDGIMGIQMEAKTAFESISTNMLSSKEQAKGLAQEYKNLQNNLKEIDNQMQGIRSGAEQDLANRAIDIEKQLSSIGDRVGETDNETERERLMIKQQQLQAELEIAKANTTQEELEEARRQAGLTESERIIERMNMQLEQAEKEKTRIKEEMDLKKTAIIQEMESYSSMVAQKRELDEQYFLFFGEKIQQQKRSIMETIALMQSATGGGQRELQSTGGSTTGGGQTNISINMGGVSVTNEADENRLVEKVSTELKRQGQLYNLGVA